MIKNIEAIEAKERYRVYEFSVMESINNNGSFYTNNEEEYKRIFLEHYPELFSEKNKEDDNGMIDNLVDYQINKVREVINYRDRKNIYLQVLVKEIYFKV